MVKKKRPVKTKKNEFNSAPFVNLKGFAVSEPEKSGQEPSFARVSRVDMYGTFAEEMAMLGVEQLNEDETVVSTIEPTMVATKEKLQTDEELFLAAMDEFPVSFDDHFPKEVSSAVAVPHRLKQIKRGKMAPDATLDLHGCLRDEVANKLNHFIQNCRHHNWNTLLVITGKGLHSKGGEAVLRNEVEHFLVAEGKQQVAEWGRAPKQYGGSGALILFLRKTPLVD